MARRHAPDPTSVICSPVDDFLRDLDHPHKEGIQLLRRAILAVDTRITEEIKWNAPSFKTREHFATFKLYPPKHIQLVLHVGAKPVATPRQFRLDAPGLVVKWPAPDRCVLTIESSEHARQIEGVVAGAIRQWIVQLPAA
jgi:predicted transport protein